MCVERMKQSDHIVALSKDLNIISGCCTAGAINLIHLRHTFITHLMKVMGNDVGTVMKYSGHNTVESFSNYIHPTDEGRIVSM